MFDIDSHVCDGFIGPINQKYQDSTVDSLNNLTSGRSIVSLKFIYAFLLQKPQPNTNQTVTDRKPNNKRKTFPFTIPDTTRIDAFISKNRKEHEPHYETQELLGDNTQHDLPSSPEESYGVAQAHNLASGSKTPMIDKDMQHHSRSKPSAMLHDMQPFQQPTSAYATHTTHEDGDKDSKCAASDQIPSTSKTHKVTIMIIDCPLWNLWC
jgi:hypothetical protein